jgi:hypothetical protein
MNQMYFVLRLDFVRLVLLGETRCIFTRMSLFFITILPSYCAVEILSSIYFLISFHIFLSIYLLKITLQRS